MSIGLFCSTTPMNIFEENNKIGMTENMVSYNQGFYDKRKDENPILNLALDTTFPRWSNLTDNKTKPSKFKYAKHKYLPTHVVERTGTEHKKKSINTDTDLSQTSEITDTTQVSSNQEREIYIEQLKIMGPKYVKKRGLNKTENEKPKIKTKKLNEKQQKPSKFNSDVSPSPKVGTSPCHYKGKQPGTYSPHYDPQLTAKNLRNNAMRSSSLFLPNEIKYKRAIYRNLKNSTEITTKPRNEIEGFLALKFAEFVKVNEKKIKDEEKENNNEHLKLCLPTIKNGRKLNICKANSFSTCPFEMMSADQQVNELPSVDNENENIGCNKQRFVPVKSVFAGASDSYLLNLKEKFKDAKRRSLKNRKNQFIENDL